ARFGTAEAPPQPVLTEIRNTDIGFPLAFPFRDVDIHLEGILTDFDDRPDAALRDFVGVNVGPPLEDALAFKEPPRRVAGTALLEFSVHVSCHTLPAAFQFLQDLLLRGFLLPR